MFTVSYYKPIILIRVLSDYFDGKQTISHHETCMQNYITRQPSAAEFCRTISTARGQSLISEHIHTITSQINHFHQSSVELFRSLRNNLSSSNVFTVTHDKLNL